MINVTKKQEKLQESLDLKDKYIGQEFQSYFIAENVILKFDINDNLDVIIEISSKMEFELYEELRKTFPEDDIKILK